MNEHAKERVSALIDGELDSSETEHEIDVVLRDPEMRRTWERYHLIGAALRGTLAESERRGATAQARPAGTDESVVSLPRAGRPRRFSMGPAQALALAASVAAVTVLGVYSFTAPEPAAVPAQPVATTTQRAPAMTEAVENRAVPNAMEPARSSPMRWSVAQPAVEARLNGYLVNHSEYLGNGMRGMLPYARIVAYDAGN